MNVLLYVVHLGISSKLWIQLNDQTTEIRHFSMLFLIILSGILSLNGPRLIDDDGQNKTTIHRWL
jgi:hypothetical protein